jgi:hypothetical protein
MLDSFQAGHQQTFQPGQEIDVTLEDSLILNGYQTGNDYWTNNSSDNYGN